MKMKKLLSALLVCLMLLPTLTGALAASETDTDLTADERYERMEAIAEFIKIYGIDSSRDDDPVMRALLTMFEDEDLYNIFMESMLGSYDSHSMFIPAGTYDSAFPTTESYVGVGITMQLDGEYAKVTDVAEGGPADEAGIKPGDLLLTAGGVTLRGKELTEISSLLRGEEGTEVTVTVRRGETELRFTLTRAQMGTPNFSSRLVEDGVYYMKWARFADTASYIQFVFAIQDMTENNCRSLILDLRGNPGGDLNMAYNVINRLLPVSVDFFGYCTKQNDEKVYRSVTSDGIGPALNKIIILSDGDSASAAEVVQVSLCDLGYAVSVGEQTYGKARGQYHLTFTDNSAAVITSVELIAPSTPDYEGVGLTPTYEVHNETTRHPAASCDPVPTDDMTLGFVGDGPYRLNRALAALGYLDSEQVSYTFTLSTLAALISFQQDYQLAVSPICNVYSAQALNSALESYADQTVTVDLQYEKALELAREYAAQPQQYVVDELGNVTNLIDD